MPASENISLMQSQGASILKNSFDIQASLQGCVIISLTGQQAEAKGPTVGGGGRSDMGEQAPDSEA